MTRNDYSDACFECGSYHLSYTDIDDQEMIRCHECGSEWEDYAYKWVSFS